MSGRTSREDRLHRHGHRVPRCCVLFGRQRQQCQAAVGARQAPRSAEQGSCVLRSSASVGGESVGLHRRGDGRRRLRGVELVSGAVSWHGGGRQDHSRCQAQLKSESSSDDSPDAQGAGRATLKSRTEGGEGHLVEIARSGCRCGSSAQRVTTLGSLFLYPRLTNK